MTESDEIANDVLAHSEDDNEWDDQPVRIEARPSGTQVISTRLPTALAEELFAKAEQKGLKPSELVREAVDHYLHAKMASATGEVHTAISAFVGGNLRIVTPLAQYRTENSNPVIEPDDVPAPPTVVALGYPAAG